MKGGDNTLNIVMDLLAKKPFDGYVMVKLDGDKVFTNLDRYGNTSAASIPIALCEAIDAGRVNRGDYLVLVGFGAGLTWAVNLIRL